MWPPPWLRSPRRVNTTSASLPNFACSSFKDVHTLFREDEEAAESSDHRPKKLSLFRRVRISTAVLRHWSTASFRLPGPEPDPGPSPPPNSENRIVLYFTSLRVVRKTFEDCRAVRSILLGFRVSIDERDLSMDARFLDELQGIMGPNKKLTLPRVFIGGRYFGGAEEIGRLHETGELKRLIQGLPLAEAGVCGTCGGHRFVLCEECSGSHKVFVEKSGFKACRACNENGLIRCPSCV
ncbi:uncharacterized protein At5g39865-like [Malania oleifera]|uniref:uncharacterized protein At5g39865-like n=1 Tax=Malania oleifera TaxID=397392 RepID=UPI0025AE5193|nr:uncharacterized protein At5g39865-like [Malania oleifera]